MTTYDLPPIWDAKKFAVRYSLNQHSADFYVNGDGKLVVSVILPDDPPIFEPPDPPPPTITSQIAALPGNVSTALKNILTWLANGR